MPPKGRKRVVAEAKSSGKRGVTKAAVVEKEVEPTDSSRNLKKKAALAENKKKLEVVSDGESVSLKENGSTIEEAKHSSIPERANGKVGKGSGLSKLKKTDEAKEEEENSNGNHSSDAKIELEEMPAVPRKRGRKKKEEQASSEQNGRANDEVAAEEQVAEAEPKAKSSKNLKSAKKGGIKSLDVASTAGSTQEKTSAQLDQIEADDPPSDVEVPKNTRSTRMAKRARNTSPESSNKGPSESEDFQPRKRTREAKVAVGAKGKKNAAKGKVVEQSPEEDEPEMKQLKVEIVRDLDLDLMAKQQLSEAEEMKSGGEEQKDGGDAKVVSGKGKAKSTKREKKEVENPKPAKAQKEDVPAKKGAAKKQQIPDVKLLDFGNSSKSKNGSSWNLKIASWNINGIRACIEKNGLSYLYHENPDILCFQETKCSKEKLPAELEELKEGYHGHWLAGDKDGYSGVGIICKEDPISISEGIGKKEHDNEGRVITAEFEKFYLVTVYVPNAGKGLIRLDYRMQWDKDFRAYLKKLDEKKPVVLCGDMNVAHQEIDIANPKGNKKNAGFTNEEREGFTALLEEGFVDTFRHLYPDEKAAYTFWTYMMNARAKNVGWRIDYFVVSEKLADNVCDSVIRKDVFGSDHCPIVLFLHI